MTQNVSQASQRKIIQVIAGELKVGVDQVAAAVTLLNDDLLAVVVLDTEEGDPLGSGKLDDLVVGLPRPVVQVSEEHTPAGHGFARSRSNCRSVTVQVRGTD